MVARIPKVSFWPDGKHESWKLCLAPGKSEPLVPDPSSSEFETALAINCKPLHKI
jgi:hypothetical protein